MMATAMMHQAGQPRRRHGFSLLELLVVIGIIGVLSVLAFAVLSGVLQRARDTKRKNDLAQMGRFLLAAECYLPDAGEGNYDLTQIAAELAAKYPQFSQVILHLPRDPKIGTETASGYRYEVTNDRHCVLYANLENSGEPVTLTGIAVPTPNAGVGVLAASAPGPNGTNRYQQISQ